MSDEVSPGFVHATEDNVERHLREHLERLPARDLTSRRILEKMLDDQTRYSQSALDKGRKKHPRRIRRLMRKYARLITKTAERF
ncbi:MAG: hypothetical protein CMD54_01475 [Gammaproteobacteria bacterium]|nr:hypothetical protein [Gammaproteobacteria bacterium]